MIVVDLAIVALATGLVSDAEPTAIGVANVVLCGSFAALLVLAGSRSGPYVLLAGSVITTAAALVDGPAVAAGVALGVAVAFERWARVRSAATLSPYGAVCGLALSVALLRLEWPQRDGATAALAASVALAVLASGWWRTPRPWRRRVGWLSAAVVALATALSGGAVVAALQARSDLEAAVDEARAGLDAIEDLSGRDAALAQLRAAERDFASANDAFDSWWAKPSLAVPVVGQHLELVRSLSGAGARLSASSVAALEAADPSRLRLDGGRVELGVLGEVATSMQLAVDDLRSTRADLEQLRGPWLLGAVERERSELASRIDEALTPAANAADGAGIALDMLGADAPRRYLLMMVTNSESRGIGGWYGSFAVVTADGGRLSLEHVGRTGDELVRVPPAPIEVPPDYADRYGISFNGPHDVRTFAHTPDFAVAGDLLAQSYAAYDARGVDGVIAIDAYGLEAMLELTGPVIVPAWADPITADNVVQILLLDQYALGGGDDRGGFQGQVVQAVWSALTAGDLASVEDVVDLLAPAVRGRRVQVFATDEAEQAFFVRVDAAGSMPLGSGDFLGVVTQNLGGNKIDWFLRRQVTYDVVYDPDRRHVRGTVRVVLENTAPASGYPELVIGSIEGFARELGMNRTWFNLYTALPVRAATVDGEPFALTEGRELGRRVYSGELLLASATSTVIEVEVDGVLESLPPGAPYRLDVLGQPVVGNDTLTVKIDGSTVHPGAPQVGNATFGKNT
jgi:hypothetical protein